MLQNRFLNGITVCGEVWHFVAAYMDLKTTQSEMKEQMNRHEVESEQDHGQAMQQVEKDHRAEVKVLEKENVRLREQLISLQTRLTVPG